MDLRNYYQKIRDTEAGILTPFAIVVSCETGDGGKSGVTAEVTRRVAAKMLVEGLADLASPGQAAAYLEEQAAAVKAAEEAAAASKVAVTMVSSDDLKKLTEDVRKLKVGTRSAKE